MRITRKRTSEREFTTSIELTAEEAQTKFDLAYDACSELWDGVEITNVPEGGCLLVPETTPTSAAEIEEHVIDTDELEEGEDTEDIDTAHWLDLAASEEHLHFFQYNHGQGYETTSEIKERFEHEFRQAEVVLTYNPHREMWAASLFIDGQFARGGVAEDTEELTMLWAEEMMPCATRHEMLDPQELFMKWKREERETVRRYCSLLEETQTGSS